MLASGADGAASEDGAGQNNAIWSEGPWGRAAAAARTEVLQRATSPGTERGSDEGSGEHEGQWQTVRREEASNGKALSDLPALKPYWGKPAVRNFREGNGNVGIMRSPLRAFALPEPIKWFHGNTSGSMTIQPSCFDTGEPFVTAVHH